MGKKKSDLTNINPALVPSVAFAVVPRTPAPQPVPTTGLGGSSEVLNSSLLGRPAVPTQEDEPFSDPESSLYDYRVMEDAGYSSVEMLAVSRQRQNIGDREPTGLPQRREHDIDEHQQAHLAQSLESAVIHENPETLYSMPLKRGQRAATSNTMQTTLEVRDAMQHVQDLSSDEEAGPSYRMSRRAEKQHSARSLHFPVEHEAQAIVSTPIQTPKSPKYQPPVSEDKIVQRSMEPIQIDQQLNLQTSPDDQLSARSRSQSARSVNLAEEHVRTLEADNEHLTTLTHDLEVEVQTYREVVSTYESGESGTAQSLLTRKQVNDLKHENESLKNSIKRLNVELSAYQAKYRPINKDEQGNMMGLPSKGPPPSWLFNIRYLNPLFLAYDDRIRDREDVIKKCQLELETLRLRTESIVKENNTLHLHNEKSRSGPVDNLEWAMMKDNARLVLEENQNLLEQISVKDVKAHQLHEAHGKEVSKLSKQLVLVKGEKCDVEMELQELRMSHRDVKQKHDKLVLDSQSVVTQEQHLKEIMDLKQKMSELEGSHRQELNNVNNRLHASEVERKGLCSQVIELSSENKRQQIETKLMNKSVRKSQQRMLLLQRAIEQSENKEISVQEYMSSLIKVAEKSAFERDTYEKVAKEHEIESKRAMKKLLHGSITEGKMQEKLKLYKMKAAARISTVVERLKEQEEMFNSQKREYERELNHLRLLIKEKEDFIIEAAIDKRDLEDQMEAVWQSANSENVRIRDELKRNVNQLRKHAGLSEALDAHDKLEAVDVSSDAEGDKRGVS